ncbi:MAG: diguanylate cyclase [Solirubrobacteraceae bacterium]
MSFRTRLTFFFVLIVVVTMVAVGIVIFRLIEDSQTGKADARTGAFAAEARQRFEAATRRAGVAATLVGRDAGVRAALGGPDRGALRARLAVIKRREHLARIAVLGRGGGALADVGDRRAIAAGTVRLTGKRFQGRIEVDELEPQSFARTLSAAGVHVVVRRGRTTLATTLRGLPRGPLPETGQVKKGRTTYRLFSFSEPEDGRAPLRISVLADSRGTASATGSRRTVAIGVLLGFLVLALLFALAVSRALHAQVGRFLSAVRRLGSGDFSTLVPTEGNDEFAALGDEFNKMSRELESRVIELQQERGRLQESIRRIGQTFASNLDRRALLELGTHTAADAVRATGARASSRGANGSLTEDVRVGEVDPFEEELGAVESRALETGEPEEQSEGGVHVRATPLKAGPEPEDEVRGVLSVARRGEEFTDDERELLTSLAGQAALSIENVSLHEQVQRQAVTDELTRLSNHRRFQDVMDTELERARRFDRELGLLMLDVDNFKRVNDTYGHPQGDAVLRAVASVLRDTAREIDEPARYGGEEMAIALPETDLEGAFNVAERVRTAIEELRVPLLDGSGALRVTASFGVASGLDVTKSDLVAAADRALYEAKRAGKNRTARGTVAPAGVGGAQ